MAKVPVSLLKISPDGTELALVQGSQIHTFSLKDGSHLACEGGKHSEIVRSLNYNASGDALVSTSDDKQVIVWKRNPHAWVLSTLKKASKKTMAAAFSQDNKTIVFADKFGDVLTFDVSSSEKERIIMGHYSSITDMILTPDGKYLITSDKDEHIRISHYPETYDIHCYCFGHTEFVAGLSLPTNQSDLLISGGGDGTLRLWNWRTGKLIDIHQFESSEPNGETPTIIPLAASAISHSICVATEGHNDLHIFTAGNNLERVATIHITTPALTACFDTKDNLWVASVPSVSTALVSVFAYSSTDKSYHPLPDVEAATEINAKCSANADSTIDSYVALLSRNAQFRKKRDENEEVEGNEDGETQAEENKNRKKNKKKNKTERGSVPTFV